MREPRWFFPPLGGGEEKGLNNSGVESFKESSSLARETAQNIGDARSVEAGMNDQPAVAVFEKLHMPRKQLPGLNRLEQIFEAALQHVKKDFPEDKRSEASPVKFFTRALSVVRNDTIPVLRIRDKNTTGLFGEEKEKNSPYFRLIRGQGFSQMTGVGGGTYGIGQRAPFAFSRLRTVFYYSKSSEGELFVGKSILCSFPDIQTNEITQPVGWWSVPDPEHTWRAIREPGSINSEFRRADMGTDLYILGFDQENWLESALESILMNFFAAVRANNLKFRLKEDGKTTHVIDSDSIKQLSYEAWDNAVKSRRKTAMKNTLGATPYFLDALDSPEGGTPFTTTIPLLGIVKLYVYRDADAPNQIAYMRRPRILVKTRSSTLLNGFAAVLMCEDDTGNDILAAMEDPRHKTWSPEEARDWTDEEREKGAEALTAIRSFINDTLKSLRHAGKEESLDVPGLAEYLPELVSQDVEEMNEEEGYFPTSETIADESGLEKGRREPVTELAVTSPTDVKNVTPDSKEGVGEGAGSGSGGTGPGVKKGSQTGRKAKGGPGLGGAERIDLSSRTFQNIAKGENHYTAIVTAATATEGPVHLFFRGVGEAGEYVMPIKKAFDLDQNVALPIADLDRGHALKVSLEPNRPKKLSVELDVEYPVTLAISGSKA